MQTEPATNEAAHSRAVREMFAGIAGRYDLLNHLLSLNIDKSWRRAVSEELGQVLKRSDALVIDVACGTGDLTQELLEHSAGKVIGTDFCRPMLEIAQGKVARAPFVEADAMTLPFAECTFDALTIAFGLRNLANVGSGLQELFRILKPGGRIAVLEFSEPVIPGFRQAFGFYFSWVLPRIGGLVSGSRGAYEYLPRSVSKFPNQKALAARMRETGFQDVRYRNLTGGIAALHSGTKTI
jgi:demethylmenaquinone methyltransferase/2-methoxy-6-polyprenyl-1,4-benzoquinol methylase